MRVRKGGRVRVRVIERESEGGGEGGIGRE